MRLLHNSPEYRIVVPGKAVSFRSPKAGEYKKLIRNAASSIFPKPLAGAVFEVRLDYFHLSERRMDMDNIAKCVLDALNGISYIDDKQVRLQTAEAHSLSAAIYIARGVVDLVKPLAEHREYLFIRVRKVGGLGSDQGNRLKC